jgi:hypothetical protein
MRSWPRDELLSQRYRKMNVPGAFEAPGEPATQGFSRLSGPIFGKPRNIFLIAFVLSEKRLRW